MPVSGATCDTPVGLGAPSEPGRSADREAIDITTRLRDGFDPRHRIAIAPHLAALPTRVGRGSIAHAATRFAHETERASLLPSPEALFYRNVSPRTLAGYRDFVGRLFPRARAQLRDHRMESSEP